ncbi:hypothetical protein GE09DRAFT_1168006 [Coniochaeta sp. 2T2.1]|nr:hypothetical protein GE09DRAFT_1168006 [Coniochaeta sp. 2T2.1]
MATISSVVTSTITSTSISLGSSTSTYSTNVIDGTSTVFAIGSSTSTLVNTPITLTTIYTTWLSSLPTSTPPVTSPPSPTSPSPTSPSSTARTSITTTPGESTASTSAKSATTQSSGTSTPTSRPAKTIIKTNIGAVVGAAVGCLIAGLLLGFLIAWCLNKRKRKRKQLYDNAYSPPPATESKAYDPPPQPPLQPLPIQDKASVQLNQFLLDALPDKELAAELHALGTLIQQHVENNYHLQPVRVNSRALASSLTQLGLDEGGSLAHDDVVTLALDPKTRHIALQHVISKVVFTGIDVSSRSRLSTLPAPMAAFLQSIPSQGHHGDSDSQATSLALSRWRVLSAFLLHPNRSQRTPLPASDAAIAPQVKSLANALDAFLAPFVLGPDRQKSHLEAVIAECTKFGYVLLSQPSEWAFVHVPDRLGQAAVVCAGLVKLSDKDGRRYGSPFQVVAPKVVQV